jgi:hypothetical protein
VDKAAQNGLVQVQQLQFAMEYCHNVLITSGLKGGEMIAPNAAADIEDGGPVQPMTNETAKPAGPAK